MEVGNQEAPRRELSDAPRSISVRRLARPVSGIIGARGRPRRTTAVPRAVGPRETSCAAERIGVVPLSVHSARRVDGVVCQGLWARRRFIGENVEAAARTRVVGVVRRRPCLPTSADEALCFAVGARGR
jgi:hypothetical protein